MDKPEEASVLAPTAQFCAHGDGTSRKNLFEIVDMLIKYDRPDL